MLIIGVLALAGLAKWLFASAPRRINHLPLSPEEIEFFRECFNFEDEAAGFEERRKNNPHIWMDGTENF